MPSIDLFPRNQIVGVFRGFREGGLEFHADLVLPYRNDFQSIPMHGQFLLVQLETPDEAVLGRITSLSSDGKLAIGAGEEFNIRAVRENRPVPEDLREQYLKYRINIRVLGVLRNDRGKEALTFVPSHRRLPHVGSPVAFPSAEVLREIAGHNIQGAQIGHFALGEYIFAQGSKWTSIEDWMQIKSPEVLIRFPIESLVSRRSFIFARAGFGKSNLTKLLFSKLYEQTPEVTKRGGRRVPVGTVIFDPDGEYFWPDDKGRPGLCDVVALHDRLVVFTARQPPSDFYGSFVLGGIRLDIRQIPPSDVISIALPMEKQDQQNVAKLRGLNMRGWRELVELIDAQGNQAPVERISEILHLDERQEAEALAARSNMTRIVKAIHDRSSQLMDMLLNALAHGCLCIIDVSQMREGQSLILSGLILRRIFDHNQEQFTAAEPQTIPTIAVVEEAQSVLNEKASGSQSFVEWVKEGRKYDLGMLLITQQPGSIPVDILSQGDNWFIFHLLSATDLTNLRRANAHFSDDLLSVLLNEPIPGQGVFWSSVGGKTYPLPIRALSFEKLYQVVDPTYELPAQEVYALELRQEYQARIEEIAHDLNDDVDSVARDPQGAIEERAIRALWEDQDIIRRLSSDDGIAWGALKSILKDNLPEWMDEQDKDSLAYSLVRDALNQLTNGHQDEAWATYKRDQKGRQVTYVRLLIEIE